MLQSLNLLFGLKSWTIRHYKGKYYISPTACEGKHKWGRGYKSLRHACNAIARHLEREWTERGPWVCSQYRAWRAGLRWPVVIYRNIRQVIGGSEAGADIARAPTIHILLAIASAISGCVLYFLVSHVAWSG